MFNGVAAMLLGKRAHNVFTNGGGANAPYISHFQSTCFDTFIIFTTVNAMYLL